MSISPILPEIVMISFFFLIYIFFSIFQDSKYIYSLLQITSAIIVIVTLYSYDQTGDYLNKIYIVDSFSQTFKVMLSCGYFLLVYMATSVGEKEQMPVEYFQNITIATFGLYLVASSGDIFTTLMSLEITTISLYVILFYNNYSKSTTNSAIKYVLISVVVSGLSFYGISLLWGATGKIFIKELANKSIVPVLIENSTLLVISFILILGSILFKMVIFPFHFSIEDLTEKGNSITSSFIITVLVVGSTSALIKIVNISGNVTSLLTWFLITISTLSILISSLKMISQEKIKNFVAFSSINNCGFILLGVICNNETGLISGVFSVACFSIIVMSLLYLIRILERDNNLVISDLVGINKKSPLIAITFAVSIAGIAGIPFTSGFIGKFLIIYAAIQKGFFGLLIVYITSTLVSALYAGKIIRNIYTEPKDENELVAPVDYNVSLKILSVFFIVIILLPGIFPQLFIEYAKRSIIMLLSFGPL